jgi:hypothetical protein
MTKLDLIKAMEDFPDDIPVRIYSQDVHEEAVQVTEICPTQTDTSENYLLIS